MMRKFVQIIAVLIASAAAGTELPATVEVVTEEAPPYGFTDAGKITGMNAEIVRAALMSAGIRGHFTSMPWAQAMRVARTGHNTLIFSIIRNEDREALFKWVGVIGTGDTKIYCLAGRDIHLNSIDDAKKYVTGAVIRDFREDYLLKHGFGLTGDLESTMTESQNYTKLKSGRIDLWPADSATLRYVVKAAGDDPAKTVKVVLDLTGPEVNTPSWMAFGLDTDDALVAAVQKGLEAVKTDGTYAAIVRKWKY